LAAFLTLTASASAGTTLLLVACRGGEGYGTFVPVIQAGSADLSTIGVPGLELTVAPAVLRGLGGGGGAHPEEIKSPGGYNGFGGGGGSFVWEVTVPEPSTWAMMLLGLGWLRRRGPKAI
jgi:hypothetical protein